MTEQNQFVEETVKGIMAKFGEGSPEHQAACAVRDQYAQRAVVMRTKMSQRLREIASDPMWADHAEIRKSTLIHAAQEVEAIATKCDMMDEELGKVLNVAYKLRQELSIHQQALALVNAGMPSDDEILDLFEQACGGPPENGESLPVTSEAILRFVKLGIAPRLMVKMTGVQ